MAEAAPLAVLYGLITGAATCILDRRLARVFARTAGFPAESGVSGTVEAAFLISSALIANLLLALRHPSAAWAAYEAIFVAILAWAASIDWRWRIIPNAITYPASVAALAVAPVVRPEAASRAIESALLGLGASGGVFLLFFLLSVAIYRHPGAFGLGDVKLAAVVGLALGYPAAVVAVFFATAAGAVLAIAWGIASRDRKAGFPYGPAIATGAFLALLVAPAVGSS